LPIFLFIKGGRVNVDDVCLQTGAAWTAASIGFRSVKKSLHRAGDSNEIKEGMLS
jgi:hypothetical protein